MKQIKIELGLFLFFLSLIIFLAIVGPFIQIWAVNTLFKTNIEYSWLNWFCVMILNSSVSAVSYKSK
jgi:hypothetical protein